MDTFLLGLLFGVAIGLWISVAIIEWRLPERRAKPPAPSNAPARPPTPPSQPTAATPARKPSVPASPVVAPAQSQPVGTTSWAPVASPTKAAAENAQKSDAPLSPEARQLYEQLLNMAQGDRAMADRLIEYERTRAPAASTETLIGNAIDRWLHDNG